MFLQASTQDELRTTVPWYFSMVTTAYLARILRDSGLYIPSGAVVLLLWKITGRVSQENLGMGTPMVEGEANNPRARSKETDMLTRASVSSCPYCKIIYQLTTLS